MMESDLAKLIIHTEDVIRRTRKILALYAQVERELSVAADQLAAVEHSAHRAGLRDD